MGTSYVKNKNLGFWTKDAFLEGLSFMLAREFEKIPNKEDWMKKLIDDWTNAATSGYVGCVPSFFDKYFDHPHRVETLRTTLKIIIQELDTKDNFLTVEDLNDNNVGLGGWIGVNRQDFKNNAQLMLDLIEGNLK